jgi:hypothetical protein
MTANPAARVDRLFVNPICPPADLFAAPNGVN